MKFNNHTDIIIGHFINLREVELEDANFILKLRCDEKKSLFLNSTDNNLQKQIDYLKRYKTLPDEWYFISEDKQKKQIGTIRIYNINNTTFTYGSWLMEDGVFPWQSIETEQLCKQFAFDELGMELLRFDVRKKNKKVVRYHQFCGSKIVAENDLDYFFELTKEDYLKNKNKILQLM